MSTRYECLECGEEFPCPDLNDSAPCCPYCDSTDIDEQEDAQ